MLGKDKEVRVTLKEEGKGAKVLAFSGVGKMEGFVKAWAREGKKMEGYKTKEEATYGVIHEEKG